VYENYRFFSHTSSAVHSRRKLSTGWSDRHQIGSFFYSAIRKPAANDFERLHRLCPKLQTVGFNGQTSGKFAPQFAEHGHRTVVLPSSSPAHMAMTFEQKLDVWRQLIEPR
jgi:G:T/U-mismatch repair DNA glycosylase